MRILRPPTSQLRDMDSRAWSTATLASPFMVQLVLGAMLIILWLLGKAPPFMTHSGTYSGERAWFLTAAAVSTLLWVPVSGLLFRSGSSRVRGVALSVVGSASIVLIGSVVFAFWALRW